jgi:hypothetical protein
MKRSGADMALRPYCFEKREGADCQFRKKEAPGGVSRGFE